MYGHIGTHLNMSTMLQSYPTWEDQTFGRPILTQSGRPGGVHMLHEVGSLAREAQFQRGGAVEVKEIDYK